MKVESILFSHSCKLKLSGQETDSWRMPSIDSADDSTEFVSVVAVVVVVVMTGN